MVDTMVAELEAAVDGDPSTPTPSSVEVGAVEAGADDAGDDGAADDDAGDDASAGDFDGDEAAAAAAWSSVFDSSVDFDGKAANLEDAESLAGTIEAYTETASGFGGISLEPTDVVIDGDTATITY
ncbi:MAG: hypothetical protein AAFP84_22555, partial [Actinomycetota bacterium]